MAGWAGRHLLNVVLVTQVDLVHQWIINTVGLYRLPFWLLSSFKEYADKREMFSPWTLNKLWWRQMGKDCIHVGKGYVWFSSSKMSLWKTWLEECHSSSSGGLSESSLSGNGGQGARGIKGKGGSGSSGRGGLGGLCGLGNGPGKVGPKGGGG